MAISNSNFLLTEECLLSINEYVSTRRREYRKTETEPHNGIRVEFEWMPGLGRFVTVYFAGEDEGKQVEGFEVPKEWLK